MAGAHPDAGSAGEIANCSGIRLAGREWLFDIHVGAIAESGPGQRQMSGRWRQQVDDRRHCFAQHGLRVAVATGNGVTRRRLPCSALVRIAYRHDLHLRKRLECCEVVSADPAASNKGDANVRLCCAHETASRQSLLE